MAHLDFLINASWIEFLTTLDDERAFRNLVWGITGTKPPELGATRCEGVCPYRGLEAFRPDDAKFFFGRENLTGWLVSALRREVRAAQGVRFLGVLGPSGSGKSSVVLAGLVPRLMAGAIEESEHWPVAILRPGDDPLKSLTEKVVPLLRKEVCPDPSLSESREQKELLADLRTDGEEAATELDRYIGLKFADDLEDRRLIIVVDQFEEVFTYRPQDDQARKRFEQARASFFANLLNAAATPGGRVVVVLTMRSDFLGDCTAFPHLAVVLSDHQKLIGPMTPEELHRAIEQPAYLVGCELKEGLSDLLIDDVKGQAGALPLLQFTLKELWTMRDVRWLTHAAYRAMGGVRGAIERGADKIYRSFNPEEQRICRRIFLHLVQLGEGTGDTTKRRVSYRELLPQDPKQAEAVRKVLLRLADPKARLITTTGADVPEGYDLRLMSSMNDASGIPTGGKGLIIVASVDNVLHIRIFGGDGKVVVDTDEKWLTEQARQIEDLRKRLESLWPPHELTKSEKSRVITAVTSTVGHTLPEAEGSVEVAHEALIRHWSELHKWIDAEIEFLRSWARLRSSARHWEEKGQRRDLLLSEGHPLAEAEDLLLCHESELDPDDIAIAYARASITKNNRRGLYTWISLCLFVSGPLLLAASDELASVDSYRAAINKMTSILDVTKLDVISESILSIPAAVVPLWVTYRKWRGRPEFKTIHLDKAFWATNFTLYLIMICCIITLIYIKFCTFIMWAFVVPFTVWAMVAAAQLWKKSRVQRYYRRRREGLCTLKIVRRRLSLMSKAGLTFALFVGALLTFVSPQFMPGVLEREHTRQLYKAHREIADYQVRDGQLERAQDSLNRALHLTGTGDFGMSAWGSEAENTASLRREVETLAQMGMVLRLAGEPQEADRRFREALGMIHNPWPAFKELKYLLNDAVAPVGRWTSYFVEPPNHFGGPPERLEQAIEYDTRLPLLVLASKVGAAPTVAQILGNGADVETRAEGGPTALMMAAATGHADVVKQLLASGADVGARTQDGVTALMAAAFHGRVQVVETLLQHGAKVNATDRAGGTALMAAASAGHADVVKQLLAAGSDRWLRRWNGEMAATLASFQGHKDVLASLFDVESFSIELMHEKATKPGGKDAARLADALVCAGDLAGRSGDFGKAATLVRQALEAIPERDDATPQRLPVLVRFSYAKAAAKEYEVAVQYMERAIAVSEVLAKRYPETALVRQEIANLYGQLAHCELFCKRPRRAIAAARTALELDASQVWVKAMLAHGLLLAGQFEEAKNLYLENRSVQLGSGQSFAHVVFLNFGELRANGISHPDMGRIEKLLSK